MLPAMPKPNSHIECSWVLVNNSIIITGGTTEKHPVNKRMILVGEVFQFHLDSLVLIFSFPVLKKDVCFVFISYIFLCLVKYKFVMLNVSLDYFTFK